MAIPSKDDKVAIVSTGLEVVGYDMTDWLDSGELVAVGGVSVAAYSGVTIANEARNSAAVVINGKSVAISKAAQFSITGQTTTGSTDGDANYTFEVTVTSDGTPARVQTFEARVQVV